MGQNCIKYPYKISEKLWAAESEGTQESRVSNNPQCARLGYHRDFSEKNSNSWPNVLQIEIEWRFSLILMTWKFEKMFFGL